EGWALSVLHRPDCRRCLASRVSVDLRGVPSDEPETDDPSPHDPRSRDAPSRAAYESGGPGLYGHHAPPTRSGSRRGPAGRDRGLAVVLERRRALAEPVVCRGASPSAYLHRVLSEGAARETPETRRAEDLCRATISLNVLTAPSQSRCRDTRSR